MEPVFVDIKRHFSLRQLIKKTFQENIEPLYGDQGSALKKILAGVDRRCEVFFIQKKPVGFIVYKTCLQHEFGLFNAFELKTAFIFDAFQKQGMGKHLFERAEQLARKKGANYLYATVSKEILRVFYYLKKQGWIKMKDAQSTDNIINVIAISKELNMSNPMQQLLTFFHLCERLKTEKRHGKTSDHEQDRVASHSWRLAIMVMFLEPYLEVRIDLLKALKIALIHDLAEVVTGDQAYFKHMFNEDEKILKKNRELKAIDEIASLLPTVNQHELIELCMEYENQSSSEAKMVKAIDKLEAQIQHNEADISVWNEYDRQYYATYLNTFCDFDKSLMQLRVLVQTESEIKLNGKE